ncbi:hypothetical protein Agub_g2340 [Astrephomene gubernaculifera]|uniref:Uncharacterized protein n=1 Tax=Astrephomene gubernaculifera TaxID=47775 RepID=A0AAD3HIJ1_9CHLO|nr:hypothetical protein Agub_g2340 [Astrephomene gubernaculifera]
MMLQRCLPAPLSGFARQTSSELQASPCAKAIGACRNETYHRRAPLGYQSNNTPTRSRQAHLVGCIGPDGSHGDGSIGDGSFGEGEMDARPAQQEPHNGGSSSSDDRPQAYGYSALPASFLSSFNTLLSTDECNWDFGPEPSIPNPESSPSNFHEGDLLFPTSHLQPFYKDLWTLTDKPGVDLLAAGPQLWDRLGNVFVILFGVGQRATEGIYSLRAFSIDGVPHETIIAFECEEEAQRYACLLEAAMEHTPQVCSIPPRELLSFCQDQAYACRLEPRGSLLIPPDINVSITDWERSLRLRDGQFAVLDSEPDVRHSGSSGGGGSNGAAAAAALTTTAAPPAVSGNSGGAAFGSALARYSGLSGPELEAIRARLESLLPPDS